MNRQQIATLIALAFHASGFIAIAFFKSSFFIALTSINLLVCMALVFWTQKKISAPFLVFCATAFIIGFMAEYLGVNKGMLFGNYSYGSVLMPQWNGVPIIIGLQWVMITYCLGTGINMLHHTIVNRQLEDPEMNIVVKKAIVKRSRKWLLFSTLVDSALLAILFDWVMEPAAIKLGFWHWHHDVIPKSNYYSWGLITFLIMIVFTKSAFKKHNIFAVHLLLIQFMFFLLINTFY